MKIQGPGGPTRTPTTEPSGTADPADRSGPVDKSRAMQPVATVAPGAVADPAAEIAAGLRSGALTPKQALDRLVDSAVATMGSGLSEKGRAELRNRLATLVGDDPYLADKARRAGVGDKE